MHSSRMRTARLLPVYPSMHRGGVFSGGCQLPVYHDKSTLLKKGGDRVLLLQILPSSLEPKGQRPYHFPSSLNT